MRQLCKDSEYALPKAENYIEMLKLIKVNKYVRVRNSIGIGTHYHDCF